MKGKILIDGKEIREYNLRWLRTQIGLVQQEPLLFSSSIRDNICYGNESASETEIVEVSREANIDEFISNLPDGYQTLVGEKGCQLSGGQKQRIAIARTLLKRPAILLLDEATSALDAESEKSVVSALEAINLKNKGGLLSKTTQITVAHRLSTIINSDIIIVMDKGEIVESGSHSTLITASQGVYSGLYQIQSMTEEYILDVIVWKLQNNFLWVLLNVPSKLLRRPNIQFLLIIFQDYPRISAHPAL